MKGYIYKHTSPSGKSYIGQTIRPELEMRWRRGKGYKTETAIGKAIKKYGWGNFTHEIISEIDFEDISELNQLEEDLILKLNTLVPNGYNLTTIGSNRITSDETRKKMSKSRIAGGNKPTLGMKFTEDHCRKISEANKGKVCLKAIEAARLANKGRSPWCKGHKIGIWVNNGSIEKLLKHGEPIPLGFSKGRLPMSDEVKQKIRDNAKSNPNFGTKGKSQSEHQKNIIREKFSKSVICQETKVEYKSLLEASKDLGVSVTLICLVCKGKKATAKGLHFKYKE